MACSDLMCTSGNFKDDQEYDNTYTVVEQGFAGNFCFKRSYRFDRTQDTKNCNALFSKKVGSTHQAPHKRKQNIH